MILANATEAEYDKGSEGDITNQEIFRYLVNPGFPATLSQIITDMRVSLGHMYVGNFDHDALGRYTAGELKVRERGSSTWIKIGDMAASRWYADLYFRQVSTGGTSYITVAGANWPTNALVGLQMFVGPQAGLLTKTVVSNTATRIDFDSGTFSGTSYIYRHDVEWSGAMLADLDFAHDCGSTTNDAPFDIRLLLTTSGGVRFRPYVSFGGKGATNHSYIRVVGESV
jgi:hypothetical protein